MSSGIALGIMIFGVVFVVLVAVGVAHLSVWTSESESMQPNQIGPLAPGEAEKWEDYKRIRNMDTDGT